MSKEAEKNQNIKDIKTDVGEIRKSFGTKRRRKTRPHGTSIIWYVIWSFCKTRKN